MTEHLTITAPAPDPAVLARIAAALDSGAVVAVPTETVYGLACRSAYPEAVRKIYELKGRPSDKALPWLVPDVDAASAFVNEIPPRAARLMRRFWPGPLTLVLGDTGATVALRMPDHQPLREILRLASGPVVATSANVSGSPPALDASEVAAAFDGRVDLIVDGGPARLGRESTIVRVAPDGSAEVLREGCVPASALDEAMAATVLFVCTGNSCRSPLAAAILERDLAERFEAHGPPPGRARVFVRSAGVVAAPGGPASPGAIEAARRNGLNLERHRTQPVTQELVDESDHVYVMAFEHLMRLRRLFGARAARARLLDPAGGDVIDPFGGSTEDYLACFRHLEGLIRARLPEIVPAAGPRKKT